MAMANDFVGWIYNRFASDPNYRMIDTAYQPVFAAFDLCFERTGSLVKGKQTQCYKVIPSDLTVEQAIQLAQQRQAAFRTKCSFLKLLQDFVVFFYVTDAPISHEVLHYLADFRSVQKSVLGNASQLRFLLETANGSYLMPEKTGLFAWLPIKNLRDEVQREILEPFRLWRAQQGTGNG